VKPVFTSFSFFVWAYWIGMFLLLELPPVFWKNCPWRTLSETVWRVEGDWHLFTVLVVVFLAVLALHFAVHLSA
jgi:hypothetical protein